MSSSAAQVEDTIVAIASPTSPAARGIVRLSGPNVVSVLAKMGVDVGSGDRSRRLDVSVSAGPILGNVPAGILLWPTTRSYTGQPSAEIHTYGSLPVLSAIVDASCDAGARAARPGEFTIRAFLAGRLDLTQAEAVLGVIDAEQRGTLDSALSQLAGNLSRPLEQMRSTTLDLLADVEAGLDFVDEDIEFIGDEQLTDRLTEIQQSLRETLRVMESRGGGAARPVVALRGEPNAGKSCLMNRLAGTDAAIVADIAGTTRDAVTVEADIGGITVTLVDTAGIESASTELTRLSQDQAERASKRATLRLWCVDASRSDFDSAAKRLQHESTEQASTAIDLWIATKCDLQSPASVGVGWHRCSAISGEGVDGLRSLIADAISGRDAEETGGVMGTAARCGQSLRRACEAVEAAIQMTRQGEGQEFIAAELRLLAESLGEVTGAVYTDDILDRVFSRFCIGK